MNAELALVRADKCGRLLRLLCLIGQDLGVIEFAILVLGGGERA